MSARAAAFRQQASVKRRWPPSNAHARAKMDHRQRAKRASERAARPKSAFAQKSCNIESARASLPLDGGRLMCLLAAVAATIATIVVVVVGFSSDQAAVDAHTKARARCQNARLGVRIDRTWTRARAHAPTLVVLNSKRAEVDDARAPR